MVINHCYRCLGSYYRENTNRSPFGSQAPSGLVRTWIGEL